MEQTHNLERLVDLASEASSDRRRELLREVSDLFLTAPDTYSASENAIFGEIMGKVAFDLEQEIRVELAKKLASQDAAPHDLICQLAQDEIAVARPVLEQSPVLDEADLVNVAEKHGQGHLLAITKRPDITPAISTVLVERGDDNVVGGLIQNETAQISAETMATVVTRAQTNEQLHAPLCVRSDLPKELMADLVKYVSSELREEILARSDMIDSSILDKALVGVGDKIRKQTEQQTGTSQAEALIEKLAGENQLNERSLVKFVRAQQFPEFICGLAKMANIDIATAKHAIFNKNHEGLAIICRSLEFDRSAFSIFVLATGTNKTRAIEDTYNMLSSYDRLTADTAQRILRFWRVRKHATSGKNQATPTNIEVQSIASNM